MKTAAELRIALAAAAAEHAAAKAEHQRNLRNVGRCIDGVKVTTATLSASLLKASRAAWAAREISAQLEAAEYAERAANRA